MFEDYNALKRQGLNAYTQELDAEPASAPAHFFAETAPPPSQKAQSEASGDDGINLSVRAKGYDALEVTIAKTSTVKSILKHFLKQHDLLDKLNSASIEFDAEPLDLKMRIGDSEIEEDDMLEVVFA